MHSHPGCRHVHINKEYSIEDLAAFHGHLGPYIVLGYRIGRYVRDHLCDDPFQLQATIHCSGAPPESCIVDGVQLGSGCTLGKRNIEIVRGDQLKCVFSHNGTSIEIVPKPYQTPPRDDRDYVLKIEKMAENMYFLDDGDLFEIYGI